MIRIGFFCLLFAVAGFAQTSIGFREPTDILPLTSYRLPTWGYSTFDIRFGANGQGQKRDDYPLYTYGLQNQADGNYQLNRESDTETLNVSTRLSIFHEVDKGHGYGVQHDDFTHGRSMSATVSGDLTYARYFTDFHHIGINVNLRPGYGDAQEYILPEPLDSGSWEDGRKSKSKWVNGRLSVLYGIGRIRNVTPVIRSLRFRERFAALGIRPDLSDLQVQDIAGHFSQYSGYNRIYDRQDKYFLVLSPCI